MPQHLRPETKVFRATRAFTLEKPHVIFVPDCHVEPAGGDWSTHAAANGSSLDCFVPQLDGGA